jgi:hypothetical protein
MELGLRVEPTAGSRASLRLVASNGTVESSGAWTDCSPGGVLVLRVAPPETDGASLLELILEKRGEPGLEIDILGLALAAPTQGAER